MQIFNRDEQNKLIASHDMVTTAKEILAGKMSKKLKVLPECEDAALAHINSSDDIKTIIAWVRSAQNFAGEVSDPQRKVDYYVFEATTERDGILQKSSREIFEKAYTSLRRDAFKTLALLKNMYNEYVQIGAMPQIVSKYSDAVSYAERLCEAVKSVNLNQKIENYIRNLLEKDNEEPSQEISSVKKRISVTVQM